VSAQTVSAGEAARRLGVTPITVQRWVDRGILNAERTAGGHRRIYVTELRRLIAESRPAALSGPLASWLDVLMTGNPVKIKSALVTAQQSLGSWATVADQVASAIAELGRQWEAGTCQIFEEHAVSESLRRGVALCAAEVTYESDVPRAVLFTVEGERHTLGLTLAELVLAEANWRSIWLGEGPPSDELQLLVDKLNPNLLIVSASEVAPPKTIARYQSALAQVAANNHVELGLAGSGAWSHDPAVHRLITFEDLRTFLSCLDGKH
jgi:MerR family transcriptional regulator, light-induced transcriptional regulator